MLLNPLLSLMHLSTILLHQSPPHLPCQGSGVMIHFQLFVG